MSDEAQVEIVNDKASQVASDKAVVVGETEAPKQQKKRTFKGMLVMAICCAAPLLLLAAIPFLSALLSSLAAVGSGLLTIVAWLACPVGMFVTMRMIGNHNKQDQR